MVSCPETLNKIYYWFFLFSSSGFLASVSCFFAQQFDYDVIIETYQIISFFPNGKLVCSFLFPLFLSLVFDQSGLCFALPFHFLIFPFLFYTFLFFCFSVFTAILYLFSHLFSP